MRYRHRIFSDVARSPLWFACLLVVVFLLSPGSAFADGVRARFLIPPWPGGWTNMSNAERQTATIEVQGAEAGATLAIVAATGITPESTPDEITARLERAVVLSGSESTIPGDGELLAEVDGSLGDAVERAAVDLAHDHVLGHVGELAREVARVRRLERGVGQAFARAVRRAEVLEHVEDPSAVIAEIGRVLRPGGVFVFSLPNRTLLSRLVLIDFAQRFRAIRVLPHDLHDWNRFIGSRDLSDLARHHGLEIQRVQGVSIGIRDLPAAVRAMAVTAEPEDIIRLPPSFSPRATPETADTR